MSNNKIQLTVDDEAFSILNKLNRRDKARFVELAIKEYYSMSEIRKFFSWNEDVVPKHDSVSKSSTNLHISDEKIVTKKEGNVINAEPQVKVSDKW